MTASPKTTRAWLAGLACAALIPWAVPAAATTFVDGEFATYSQNIWGADPGVSGITGWRRRRVA